jgi:hypothetical protein
MNPPFSCPMLPGIYNFLEPHSPDANDLKNIKVTNVMKQFKVSLINLTVQVFTMIENKRVDVLTTLAIDRIEF